ncbi:Melibiase-domain-containing protein [Dendryphion nanum]|uniref:Alpha-galactosidase n=1 Tax=Dendryphion nanum TaxID=256645 RepID=A0A9P9IAG1_9PLEO|nr:Melibiase-domain-containing protein [Dendryphion nanum]
MRAKHTVVEFTSDEPAPSQRTNPITTTSSSNTNFILTGKTSSYLFSASPITGDLISSHFGARIDDFAPSGFILPWGWHSSPFSLERREFPDQGRGDARLPAIHLEHVNGDTVSAFKYASHRIVLGKPGMEGFPATFGEEIDVSTLEVTMWDEITNVRAILSYSIFPEHDAVVRSFKIVNEGEGDVVVKRAASFSTDFENLELEVVHSHGDWGSEFGIVRRKVEHGETSFRSSTGYSSHLHNPFFALVTPQTAESTGEAWGFSLVWSGSFEATAERSSTGLVRVQLGLNSLQTDFRLAPGESFQSPEAVAVYSSKGLGGMSRSFHDLYRNHLSRSKFTKQVRPVLLNSWEGLGCKINEDSLVTLAGEAAELGMHMFVMDDGWFGVKYPRKDDSQGLGDWTPDPRKFPHGLGPFVDQINKIKTKDSSQALKFGIWVEPEMVNPKSRLYEKHPDWVLFSDKHDRTTARDQLVLNLSLPEVQNFIVKSMTHVIESANIQYIKWDSNRAMHETAHPSTSYLYILGLYRILSHLTTTYPHILFEGCASGGGRLDPGLLYYFPQHWVSDNTDAADRLNIILGASLIYPLSSLSSHITSSKNYLTNRTYPFPYRAHVSLLSGSFGLELNPSELTISERTLLPSILSLWRRTSPLVINGEFFRLAMPSESNFPAALFVFKDKSEAVLFAFQQRYAARPAKPPVRLSGLEEGAKYVNDWDGETYSGRTLMGRGIWIGIREGEERGDWRSWVVGFKRVEG